MSKVLDDAKANAESAAALVSEIETSEQEGTVTPVDKTVTSVVVNYSDGSSDTLSPSPLDAPGPTVGGDGSSSLGTDGANSVDSAPADSDSGEPVPAPEPVAAGTIPD